MKKWFLLVCLLGLAFPLSVQARPIEVGLSVGAPLGVSALFWNDATHSWALAIGSQDGGTGGHIDYLFHDYRYYRSNRTSYVVLRGLYYGLGARLVADDGSDTELGVRVPVGWYHRFENTIFSIFIEGAPYLNFTPDFEFGLEGAVGVRVLLGQ